MLVVWWICASHILGVDCFGCLLLLSLLKMTIGIGCPHHEITQHSPPRTVYMPLHLIPIFHPLLFSDVQIQSPVVAFLPTAEKEIYLFYFIPHFWFIIMKSLCLKLIVKIVWMVAMNLSLSLYLLQCPMVLSTWAIWPIHWSTIPYDPPACPTPPHSQPPSTH